VSKHKSLTALAILAPVAALATRSTLRQGGNSSNVAKLLYRPLIRWTIQRTLVGRNRCRGHSEYGRFAQEEVDDLLAQAWRRFDDLAPGLPEQPTIGSRMNVALAGITLAVFQTLLAAGMERGYAIELFADAAWRIYAIWGRIPDAIARRLAQDPVERLRMDVDAFLRFPFNPPGYRFSHIPEERGVAFDMLHCPIAEYLGSHGAADLCTEAWCNLDYSLAEMWGGRCERTGTLVTGSECCDFRWRVQGG
jgi:hypothetical protein